MVPQDDGAAREAGKPKKKRLPRPDELTRETFEFISAIDHKKRAEMRSFLELDEILDVFCTLGYEPPTDAVRGLQPFIRALDAYKEEHGRLFPNWSEIFEVLVGLGYERQR